MNTGSLSGNGKSVQICLILDSNLKDLDCSPEKRVFAVLVRDWDRES